MVNKKQIGLYRFMDINNQVIYVGRSQTGISERLRGHKHLPEECYESVCSVEYLPCENRSETVIMVLFYINKYKPKYNTVDLYEGKITTEIKNVKWHKYEDLIDDTDYIETLENVKSEALLLQSEYYKLYKDDIFSHGQLVLCGEVKSKSAKQLRMINEYNSILEQLGNLDEKNTLYFHKTEYSGYMKFNRIRNRKYKIGNTVIIPINANLRSVKIQ